MDPVKEIAELKAERTALKQQLTAPGISEAKDHDMRQQIIAIDNQIVEWIKRLPPPSAPSAPPTAHVANDGLVPSAAAASSVASSPPALDPESSISQNRVIAMKLHSDTAQEPKTNSAVFAFTPSPPPSAPPPAVPRFAPTLASSPSSQPSLALKRVCTVIPVLRHIRVRGVADIVKITHVSDTFRDALESYSATVWRRLASRLESSSLSECFMIDECAWVAHNLLTVGQLDGSRTEKHPVYVAAAAGAVDVLRVCIAAIPACIDVRDGFGETALHRAAFCGHTECARELLAAGADITVTTTHGWTALHCAANAGNTDVIRALAAHADFAKIRDRRNDDDHETALHVASYYGHNGCVRELLAAGVAIGVVTDGGSTALHFAVERRHVGVVRLLAAHADFVNIRDARLNGGATAVGLAKTDEIKQLLLSNNV